jgi:hypothetical protein
MNPFDVLTAINEKKPDPFQELGSYDSFNPFMVNRGLSQFHDTVFYANEMNTRYELDKELQFQYLYHDVPKRKRFAKWAKKEASVEIIEMIAKYYDCSVRKAVEYASILTEEQKIEIKNVFDLGGKRK